jgi:hypothetical protein
VFAAIAVPVAVPELAPKLPPVAPLTTTVTVPPLAHKEGLDGVNAGVAFTVKAFPLPVDEAQVLLLTTILPLPLAPAGKVTVDDVALEYANVAAIPFTVAVEMEVKLVPVSVITWPLPAHALVGDTAVTVGAVQPAIIFTV